MDLRWIPNTLSLGNLLGGFLSIVFSFKATSKDGSHDLLMYSSLFILLAALFDVLDGRIARKINKPNPLGKELDSLADLVTFALAPGILFYVLLFGNHPVFPSPISEYWVLGIFIAFLFPLSGALRLAKFNIAESRNYFIGLPSPIAGGSCAILFVFNQLPDFFNKVPEIFGFSFKLSFKLPLDWYSILAIFLFYTVLMNVKIIFPKSPPSFMNFSKKNPMGKNILSGIYLLALLIFFKFFLLIYTLLYTFKPIFTYKRVSEVNSV